MEILDTIQEYSFMERMFDLCQSECERVRSGCGRKGEPLVVEPRAAGPSSILNNYDSEARIELPSGFLTLNPAKKCQAHIRSRII